MLLSVLVTGAYGLIGAACLARLHVAGHDVVAAGRSLRALLAGLSLAVRPAARCALLVLLLVTLLQLTGLWFRPTITFVGLLDVVAFKLPMVLLILFILGILDDR